jgi:hypothetical protein
VLLGVMALKVPPPVTTMSPALPSHAKSELTSLRVKVMVLGPDTAPEGPVMAMVGAVLSVL